MTELLTAAEMRAAEQAAFQSGQATGLELMERAGAGVVDAVLSRWPELTEGRRSAVLLCGPGNNGGDGYVIARLLHGAGWDLRVLALGDPAKLPPDARANHDRWIASGVVEPLSVALGGFGDKGPDLVVDALFGTGLTRKLDWAVEQPLSDIAHWRERHHAFAATRVVAVDIPSGLGSDDGADRGARLAADLTVTFHRAKTGHYLGEGPRICGALEIVDIGLTGETPTAAGLMAPGRLAPLRKVAGGYKYDYGHLLVLCGGPARGGAARLAARAALRIGAGLVTLCPPDAALAENAGKLDAIMLRRVDGARDLSRLLEDDRLNALCLGPGLGVVRAGALAEVALETKRAAVLDADALTALAADAGLFGKLHEGCVLTPHWGEFRRLFPKIAGRMAEDAVVSALDAVREAARTAGCAVLLKGTATVIAAPDGRALVSAAAYGREAPWLATAGTGDVLAGITAGLLARGAPPLAAAGSAAWLHVEAARRFGPGLIAEDLAEQLPGVLRDLGV